MDESDTSRLNSAVLGQLLLMQNVLCNLPDAGSIFDFVCRGLADMPGVGEATHAVSTDKYDEAQLRVPLRAGASNYGELRLRLCDPGAFAPYEAYVKNFAFMVSVILEEKHQRRLNEEHKALLEARVQERTRQLTQEIGERRAIEEELRRSRNMLALTLDSVPQAIFWKDRHSVYLGCNRVFAQAAGFENPEQIVGLTDFDLPWPRGEAEAYRADDRAVIESGQPKRHIVEPLQQSSGVRLWIDTTKVPLCDQDGRIHGVLGVYEDITERVEAEAERTRLQAQLVQAQKMESVGRLAGGVAHDFNNMLQAIIGTAELALRQKPAPEQADEAFREILNAARRSADLTRQLLAFARKQSVSPRVLDLNDTVASIIKMLRRLIREDIRLAWMPGPDPWPVKMDPMQIDQMLANLTVNARDAIRGPGRITIETANRTLSPSAGALPPGAVPGDYVTLTISDTGCGMAPGTIAHIFEPFFTTKPAGEGTGLGLATVYGIVKQNDGYITVASEVGRGTTFTIGLPRSAPAAVEPGKPAIVGRPRGSETILIVEDEEQILRLARRILEQLGYVILAHGHPEEALKTAGDFAGHIHLLITDVVMPGMNGRDLLGRVAALRPGIRALFISGYASDVLPAQGTADLQVPFLHKPFSIDQLAHMVRKVLDEAPGAG